MKTIKQENGVDINVDCIPDSLKNRVRLSNGSERTLYMDTCGPYVYPDWSLLGKAPKVYLRNLKQGQLNMLMLLTN